MMESVTQATDDDGLICAASVTLNRPKMNHAPMNHLDRLLFAMQGFHGDWHSAQRSVRAMALLFNFHPFCRKTSAQKDGCFCPFEQLNGFRYHDHWLSNLLIATFLNGRRPLPNPPHTN